MTDRLASRRARVRRIAAKRPAVEVDVTYVPNDNARERLIEVLLDLLADGRAG